MRIRGTDLTPRQREEVLRAFVHRWTKDNPQLREAWAGRPGRPTGQLISDDEWIITHAFHFVKDGSRLTRNRRYAEPVYATD